MDRSIQHWIDRAAKHEIVLQPEHFIDYGSGPTLDGMEPGEWLDAMTME